MTKNKKHISKSYKKKYKVEMSSCKSIELKGFEGSLVDKLS